MIQLAFKTNDPVNSSMTSLEDLLVDQGPVIVVVYSDFWALCLAAKPVVNRLERALAGDFAVVRINIMSDIGKDAVHSLDIRMVPTFVILDNAGQEIWRTSGTIPTLDDIASLRQD